MKLRGDLVDARLRQVVKTADIASLNERLARLQGNPGKAPGKQSALDKLFGTQGSNRLFNVESSVAIAQFLVWRELSAFIKNIDCAARVVHIPPEGKAASTNKGIN